MSFPLSTNDCVTGFGAVLNCTLDNSGNHNYGKVLLQGTNGKKIIITDILYSYAPSLAGAPIDYFAYGRLFVAKGDAPIPVIEPDVADFSAYPNDVVFSMYVGQQSDIIKPSRPLATLRDGEAATVFISKCYHRDSATAKTAKVQMIVYGRYESLVSDEVKFVNSI